MGEINDALGGGHILRGPNKQYIVPPPTQACYAAFERWLENGARLRLEARRKTMTAAEYEEEKSALRRDINSYVYSWGSQCAVDALRSAVGNTEFAAILIRQTDNSVTAAEIMKIAEHDPDHYAEVMKAVLGVEDDVPNEKAESQQAG